MTRNRFSIFTIIISSLLVLPGYAQESNTAAKKLKILNGQPRLIVVNGYSTSFQWPDVLQKKLDRFFQDKGKEKGKIPVQVVKATKGGTPIAKWIDINTGQARPAWESVKKTLASKGDRPAIVLGQQSLQWAFGTNRNAGITGPTDKKNIKSGSQAIKKYVDLLHKSGADHVFVAMHIYKHPMEPQIGNERLALADYAKTKPKNFSSGPDVWEPTKPIYPWGFASDKLHPGKGAIAVMAHLWFEALCKHDGIEVPQWSRDEMDKALKLAKAGAGDSSTEARRTAGLNRSNRTGGRSNRTPSPAVLRKYDKNGDGKLNEKEQAVFRKAQAERRRNKQNKQKR